MKKFKYIRHHDATDCGSTVHLTFLYRIKILMKIVGIIIQLIGYLLGLDLLYNLVSGPIVFTFSWIIFGLIYYKITNKLLNLSDLREKKIMM